MTPPPKNSKRVHVIITGGTIDSHYEGTKDTVVPNNASIIPGFLNSLKLYIPHTYTLLCMKDSREISNTDRRKMLAIIERSRDQLFLITHGTYTMPDTARYLKAHLKSPNKTVILTGSMLPIQEFTMSDGPFNLGFSIAALAHINPGVYVCMNGRVFSPEEVVKILKQGRFSSILGESIK